MSDKTIPVYPDKCSDAVWQPRRKTHAVKIQNGPVTVTVGGGAPVVVQSMTNTATENVADTVEQVKALARAGSELVRLTVNTPQAAMAVPEIRAQLDAEGFFVPLVGDFHYNGHKLLADYPHPVYVRVGRNAVPDVYEDDDFDYEIGKAIQLQDGRDLTIIGCGETVFHALQAGKRLAAEGVSTRVIDMHTLKPADTEAIVKAARETGRIITVEEHSMYGGLGGIVAETVAQACPVPMRILGIPDENAVHGTPLEIFHHYKLDADGIYETAREMLHK